MSEFYLLRRNSIADLSALFGFLVGFLGSAPFAWPYLQVGFQTGEITKGFAWFLFVIVGAGVVCGGIGLVLGRAGGWLWERGHRYLRLQRHAELPGAPTARDVARVERDRAIVAALSGSTPVEIPGIRFDTAAPDPKAYLALLEQAGFPIGDEAALERALRRTTNMAAWHGRRLVGIARILTDGHRYSALAELVVDPEFRRRGIGQALVRRAGAAVQTPLSVTSQTAGCESLLSDVASPTVGRTTICLAFLTLIAAPTEELWGQTVRDSAGVRLVHYALRDRPLSTSRVDSVPILEIGGDGQGGRAEFTNVAGVARLSDGRIAVADGGSSEIRIFEAHGRFLRAFGRRGRGPGEFTGFSAMRRRADTLMGVDPQLIVHAFAPDGSLLRTFARPRIDGFTIGDWIGFLPSGHGVYLVNVMPGGEPVGRSTQLVTPAIIPPSGNPRVLPERFGGWEQYRGPRQYPLPIAYGPRALGAVTSAGIWIGYPSTFDLTRLDPDGRPRVRLVRAVDRDPVTREDRAYYAALSLGVARDMPPDVRAIVTEQVKQLTFAEVHPAFSAMVASRLDEVWVNGSRRGYQAKMTYHVPDGGSRWSVFAPDGRWLAQVDLPARFLPFDIGHDYVAGLSRDADDVDRVSILRLIR